MRTTPDPPGRPQPEGLTWQVWDAGELASTHPTRADAEHARNQLLTAQLHDFPHDHADLNAALIVEPTANRPARQTRCDRDLARLDLACRTDTNTLIAVQPGADLRALVASTAARGDRTVIEIDCAPLAAARDLITAVTERLVSLSAGAAVPAQRSSPLSHDRPTGADTIDLLAELAKLRGTISHGVILVLDHPEPKAAHQLFGTLRDEVWETRLTWIILTTSTDARLVSRRPADAFFLMKLNMVEQLDR